MKTLIKMKHTKGQWLLHPFAGGNVISESGRLVASCMGYSTNTDDGEHVEENQANAQIITAVPDMLEALEIFLQSAISQDGNPGISLRQYKKALELGKSAIAKAKGEKL